jgi:hypothetical protein
MTTTEWLWLLVFLASVLYALVLWLRIRTGR